MKTSIRSAIAACCVLLICSQPASAYLDPGTGSLILQSVIAGIAGALVAGRFYWDRIKSYLAEKFSRGSAETDGNETIEMRQDDNDTGPP